MTPTTHRIYTGAMIAITILVTAYMAYTGFDYYRTPLEERFYHPHHDWFKPSGVYGHGIGIAGTLMMLIGVVIYIARKRYGFLSRYIRLKYLLEFHIFLCTLGPILVLFHTAFKFGGIVSIAFWSMVAVVLSGVIGRFIYIQIPRTIEGQALSLNEVQDLKSKLELQLQQRLGSDTYTLDLVQQAAGTANGGSKKSFFGKVFSDRKVVAQVRASLKQNGLPTAERRTLVRMVKDELALSNKISRLNRMQQLFEYWHVAHLPFALIMLIILLIHVGVTLAFGYKWIF